MSDDSVKPAQPQTPEKPGHPPSKHMVFPCRKIHPVRETPLVKTPAKGFNLQYQYFFKFFS